MVTAVVIEIILVDAQGIFTELKSRHIHADGGIARRRAETLFFILLSFITFL